MVFWNVLQIILAPFLLVIHLLIAILGAIIYPFVRMLAAILSPFLGIFVAFAQMLCGLLYSSVLILAVILSACLKICIVIIQMLFGLVADLFDGLLPPFEELTENFGQALTPREMTSGGFWIFSLSESPLSYAY